jgi:hypothetical protein
LPAWQEVGAVAVAVVIATMVLALARGELGLVWDEPPGIERQHAVWSWLRDVLGSPEDRARALSPGGMARGWPFAREAPDEHGPVYALLSLVTWKTTGWLVGPLRGHRLATLVLFGVMSGLVFRLCRRHWGLGSGLAAAGALVFNPRLFAHAQLATTDVIMACFWFFAAYAFLRSCETGRRPWLFGVLTALALMSKLTGSLVLAAMAVWSLTLRPRGAARVFAWSLPLILPVMIAVHPGWWLHPIEGPMRWGRGLADYQQKVPTYYLGRVYDYRSEFLPWHNPLVLMGTMVPVGLLALGAAGIARLGFDVATGAAGKRRMGDGVESVSRSSSEKPFVAARPVSDTAVACWAFLNFAVLIVLRMLPVLPGHDGLRQLVAALGFFAVLAGYGASGIVSLAGRLRSAPHLGGARWAVTATKLLVMLCVGSAAWVTVRIHPHELAYYNILIGGPRGAKTAGMETTYYWDAVGDEVLAWMNARLPQGATVLISPPPDVRTFGWLQRWGKLREDLVFLNLDPPHTHERLLRMVADESTYLIFLVRQGLYMPKEPGRSNLSARLAEAPALYEWAPDRVGVRLLAVFDRATFRAVLDNIEGEERRNGTEEGSPATRSGGPLR